jgi:hypothetical protein
LTRGRLYTESKKALPDWFEQTNDDNALTQAFGEAKREWVEIFDYDEPNAIWKWFDKWLGDDGITYKDGIVYFNGHSKYNGKEYQQ